MKNNNHHRSSSSSSSHGRGQELSRTKPYVAIDDDDYFLFCEEERHFMAYIQPWLVAECRAGKLSWNKPLPMADRLKLAIQRYTRETNINMPTHTKYLQDMLAFIHKKIEDKDVTLHQNPTLTRKAAAQEDEAAELSREDTSSRSQTTASTSNSNKSTAATKGRNGRFAS